MSSPRRKIVAGNWKMNLDRSQARSLAAAVAARSSEAAAAELVLCPPALYLDPVLEAVAHSPVSVGGQNMHDKASGAFTGEIAPPMLIDLGCRYVILGHSERRTLFGETDTVVNAKARAALAAGLTPIVCVGETLQEREAGRTGDVVTAQVRGSLAGLSAAEIGRLVIAYEPVWAIGTGKVATPEQAQEVHALIRRVLGTLASPEVAAKVRIQYGGSVKPDNAAELAAQPDIDGALVGGASLKADDFLGIARAFGG
ncbi:MAG: triose-phosphate isomerase [Planctomycetota bacterium]|nr:triose-phosphate isomerase [Verrucomicrobiota bacterium]MBM4013196.1 triose-phosphate isomerase [Planctomycetota bacterium]